jgi:hypothetical protein
MEDDIPVVVRMRAECARCGRSEDDTYEFDMPFAKVTNAIFPATGKRLRRPPGDPAELKHA